MGTVGARGDGNGFAPGQGGVEGEESFQGEDGHLEEMEGEPRNEVGDDKGGEGADDVKVIARGGVGDARTEIVEERFEQDMEDVEAVTDAAQPAERSEGKYGAGQTSAQNQRDGCRRGDADGGKAEPELDGIGERERSGEIAGVEKEGETGEEGRLGKFADQPMGTGLAAGRSGAVAHGQRYGATEGEGSGLGNDEVIVEMMRAGAGEGWKGVDGEQKEFGEDEEPDADAKGVTAAMREEQNQRPDEIELLFDGQGPEVIEGQG